VRVDAQHLLDEFVLAEVDLHAGDGWQDGVENRSSGRVITCQAALSGTPDG
jgi:hypothetical protein